MTLCKSVSRSNKLVRENLPTHKLKHEVDIPLIVCLENAVQFDDVRVVAKFLKEEDFPKGSLKED